MRAFTVYGDAHFGSCRPAITLIPQSIPDSLGFQSSLRSLILPMSGPPHGRCGREARTKLQNVAKRSMQLQLWKNSPAIHWFISIRTWLCSILGNLISNSSLVIFRADTWYRAILKEAAYEVKDPSISIRWKQRNNSLRERLSGRVIDELMSGSRDLDGQEKSENAVDLHFGKNASRRLMKWDSPRE